MGMALPNNSSMSAVSSQIRMLAYQAGLAWCFIIGVIVLLGAFVGPAIRALTRPRGQDPLLAASGLVDGLPADLAEHVVGGRVGARLRPHLETDAHPLAAIEQPAL